MPTNPYDPTQGVNTPGWEFVQENAGPAIRIRSEGGGQALEYIGGTDPNRVYNVSAYGAKGDGVTDDTAAIQAAINAAGHGVVGFQNKIYNVSSTLTIGKSTQFLGAGGSGYFFGSAPFLKGTVLKWTGGASPVVLITPATTAEPVINPRVENICIDGQGVATYCLRIEATVTGVFRNIAMRHAVTSALWTGQTALGGYTGLNYVYGCDFSNLWIDQGLTGDGDCIQVEGNHSGSGDTTFCKYSGLMLHHKDGRGLAVLCADTNQFELVNCSRTAGGVGIGVELGGQSGGGNACQGNLFLMVWPGLGGVTARATGFGNPSHDNTIIGYSLTDLAPRAVVEPNAGLDVQYLEPHREAESSAYIKDDFLGRGTGSTSTGEIGWSTSGTITKVAAPVGGGHPGIVQIDTSAVSGTLARIYLEATGVVRGVDDAWVLNFMFKLTQADTDTLIRIGLVNNQAGDPSTEFTGIVKEFADTNLFAKNTTGAVDSARVDLGAADTNWHKLRMRRVSSTIIGFKLDGAAEVQINNDHYPTTNLFPIIQIKNQTAVSKTIQLDFFDMIVSGLSR